MTPQRLAGLLGLAAAILLACLAAYALVARFRGRTVGRTWWRLLAAAAGGHVGFALGITRDDPILRLLLVLAVVGVSLMLAILGRRGMAGWFGLGIFGPWTLRGWLSATNGSTEDLSRVVILGVVGTLVALAAIAAGDTAPIPLQRPETRSSPGGRTLGLAGEAIRNGMTVGPLTTMELAGYASLVVLIGGIVAVGSPLPPVIEAIATAVLGVVVGTEIGLRTVPGRVRSALETMSFVAEWELERLRATGYHDLPRHAGDVERWLKRHPERNGNRFVMPELLVWVGRHDEAAEVAARMPDTTPYERFERAVADDLVDWARGGAGNPDPLRALAEAIGPPTAAERLRAEAQLAVRQAERVAAQGGDALAPLADARRLLDGHVDPRFGPVYRAQLRQAMVLAPSCSCRTLTT